MAQRWVLHSRSYLLKTWFSDVRSLWSRVFLAPPLDGQLARLDMTGRSAVKACQKIRTHLQVKRGQPLNPNSQVTRVLCQLKIHWGCRSCGVPAARARGEEDVLTWGPPVKVNFELATPNSAHGCTLASPSAVWRRGPGCIVHVQCTCKCFERIIFLQP